MAFKKLGHHGLVMLRSKEDPCNICGLIPFLFLSFPLRKWHRSGNRNQQQQQQQQQQTNKQKKSLNINKPTKKGLRESRAQQKSSDQEEKAEKGGAELWIGSLLQRSLQRKTLRLFWKLRHSQ